MTSSRGSSIQPLLLTRVVLAIGLIAVGCLAWWGDPLPGGLPVHATVMAVLVWLAARSLRLGVLVTPSAVEVRGYLWDRRVPRSAIVEVTDAPAVVWCDERGRERRTPVLGLVRNSRAVPAVETAHRSRAAELQRLLLR